MTKNIKNKSNLMLWILAIISTVGIIRSPLFGDDWPNSFNGYWAEYFYNKTGVSAWLVDSYFGTISWIERFGRFIPGGNLLSKIFIISESIVIYKLLQWVSVISLIYLISRYLLVYSKFKYAISLTILLFLLTLQFRHDFDPYIGFTFILPLVLICLISILIIIEKIESPIKKNKKLLYLSFFIPVIGMVTYEYTFVLLPITIFLILKSNKILQIKEKILIIAFINFPVLFIGALSLIFFRKERSITTGTYEIAFEFKKYAISATSQLLAPLPFSQVIFGTTDLFKINLFLTILIFSVILKIVWMVFEQVRRGNRYIDSGRLLIIGIWFWVIPALFVSISGQWQEFLKPGKSYLPVIFQQFGIILIFFVLIELLNKLNKNIYLSYFVRLIFATGLTLNIINNQQFLINDNYKKNRFEILKVAIENNLFSDIENGSFIISNDSNDTHEINRAVISILSKKDLSNMKTSNQIWTQSCLENLKCDLVVRLNSYVNHMELKPLANTNFQFIDRPYQFGISDYKGWRIIKDQAAPTYFLDALHYFNGVAIFTISPIYVKENRVFVNREKGKIMWVSLDEKFPLLAKKVNFDVCISPQLDKIERYKNSIIVSQKISGGGSVDIKDSFSGVLCQ